jgi:hypothetical protein
LHASPDAAAGLGQSSTWASQVQERRHKARLAEAGLSTRSALLVGKPQEKPMQHSLGERF